MRLIRRNDFRGNVIEPEREVHFNLLKPTVNIYSKIICIDQF